MKVVLFALNGSFTHTNLAIRCLREPLVNAGFEVELCEYNLRDRTLSILDDLYERNADVYGFSCYIWNINEMLAIAGDLHKLRPEAKMIFGGPEASFDTERFDGCVFIDHIVVGEGEDAVLLICKALRDKTPCPRIVRTPLPDVMGKEGILYSDTDTSGGNMLYYESSRGCPYHCAYCLSSVSDGVRFKSVADTLDDLEEFEKLHRDIKIIKFVDRTFNFNVARANEIWRALLDGQYTKNYHFEICATLLNEESFEILSKFPKGKIQLEAGLQSTNEDTLREVSRHIDPALVLRNLKRIRDMGNIHVHLDLIAGLPYESYERFARSFDDAYFSADMLQLGFLKLLHGTALRDNAAKYGYVYSSEPPYTVLSSDYITFSELQKLHAVSDVLERFRHSGKFADCIEYAVGEIPSPFRFFEGLAEYIQKCDGREIQKISQPDAFRLLYGYVSEIFDGGDKLARFTELMHGDFVRYEARKVPNFLK